MAGHSLNKYRYPVRNANRFELLAEGNVYFTAMLDAIDSASQYILLEQYLISSGKVTHLFIDHLVKASEKGVQVFLLLDDFGATELDQRDRHRIQHSSIRLCFYNPVRFKRFFNSLFRDHRKLLLVDGEVAFVGGAGLADEFSEDHHGKLAWHDVMLKIEGDIINDWYELFAGTWQKQTRQPLPIHPSRISSSAQQAGRLLTANPLRKQEIYQALIKHLRRSKTRIWITSPYFVTTRKLRRLLRQAANRGVDVRLLLPGQHSDHPWISFAARRHYTRLLRHKVRIYEYQPRFTHSKLQLCDDWVSIGSSNLDRWNQHWNLDANQAIYDADFAEQTHQLFVENFSHSVEIDYTDWQQRPLLNRLQESISGQMVKWLEKLFNRKKKRGD